MHSQHKNKNKLQKLEIELLPPLDGYFSNSFPLHYFLTYFHEALIATLKEERPDLHILNVKTDTKNHKPKILYVDDEHLARQSLIRRFRNLNFSIYAAETAQQALDMAKSIHFDVAIFDINMPNINGLELYKIFKKNQLNLPVIMMSGLYNANLFKEVGLKNYTFLDKACKTEELLEKISSVIHPTSSVAA